MVTISSPLPLNQTAFKLQEIERKFVLVVCFILKDEASFTSLQM
jgi:hypothetical protein